MSKELEALERLYCAGRLDLDYVSSPKHKEDYNLIENALKNYEWLKLVISIDMFDQLPTPEDKIRFLKIMGVELWVKK